MKEFKLAIGLMLFWPHGLRRKLESGGGGGQAGF